ncbi:hypothetical protein ACFQ3Z_34680 [Streptomyces nogalater]
MPDTLRDANPALQSLGIDVRIAADARGADGICAHAGAGRDAIAWRPSPPGTTALKTTEVYKSLAR